MTNNTPTNQGVRRGVEGGPAARLRDAGRRRLFGDQSAVTQIAYTVTEVDPPLSGISTLTVQALSALGPDAAEARQMRDRVQHAERHDATAGRRIGTDDQAVESAMLLRELRG